jgi:dephospho-CoA kinase
MILGITGGTGSGKTTLLEIAQEQGFRVLDCDAIYHGLLETDSALLSAIEHRFPGVVADGVLQRKKLGAMVFADAEALEDLNRITHAAVCAEVKKQLMGADRVAIDAIALFESGLDGLCQVTVAVTAPVENRIRRLVVRDGVSEDYARSRILAQKKDDWYQSRCHHLLVNDGSQEAFRRKCLAFFAQLGIMEEKPKEVHHDQ